jgi:hypothetical protein
MNYKKHKRTNMPSSKRPFYIIGHNPNTIEEAKAFLDKGANGLEPDIVYAEGKFYVSHQEQLSYEGTLTVETYMQGLNHLLDAHSYNLAIMVWDIKTTNFDPNAFMALVRENLSAGMADRITMLMTHADDHQFINRYTGQYPNVGIGVDESNLSPLELQQFWQSAGQQNFSYADGITTFVDKPGIFKNITGAQACRNLHEPGSFGLVYTWALSREPSLRKYLNTYIDGIIVDLWAAEKLGSLLMEETYRPAYQIAENGYNPFTTPARPRYTLEIKTADKLFAGTDADILFTLHGDGDNTLKGLPFNAATPGALERGTITCVPLEGADIGTIRGITIELLSGGPGAAWLPQQILVSSNFHNGHTVFHFDSKTEWIKKDSGPVTKFSS